MTRKNWLGAAMLVFGFGGLMFSIGEWQAVAFAAIYTAAVVWTCVAIRLLVDAR